VLLALTRTVLTASFWGIILYPASDAPRFQKGTIAMVVVIALLVGWLLLTWRVEIGVNKKYEAAFARDEAEVVEEYVLEDGKEVGRTTKTGATMSLSRVPLE
jgi:hypothetical protein